MRSTYYTLLFIFSIIISCRNDEPVNSFRSNWKDQQINRPWAGAAYWLNPLQAWHQKEGSLHCVVSGGDRNVALLTRSVNEKQASFQMKVDFFGTDGTPPTADSPDQADQAATDGIIPRGLHTSGWIGFQVGLTGQFNDFRDDVIKGRGLGMGLTKEGQLFIGDLSNKLKADTGSPLKGSLSLIAQPKSDLDQYILSLSYYDPQGNKQATIESSVHASWLPGQVALTCSQSIPDTLDRNKPKPDYTELKDLNKRVGGTTTFAFNNWELNGEKISVYEERSYGPILWAQHTLSDKTLKMSVQMVPVGNDTRTVKLIIVGREEKEATIDLYGNNALFRLTNWDNQKDHSYKVVYTNRAGVEFLYEGTIRKEPTDRTLKLASLSCVDDRGFPHQDLVDNVTAHQPDLLSFHGDQLYERVAGYGVERNSKLDYLRKWYIFGWSFRGLMRDIPTVIIPDDHDVFHGNLWGEGGKAANVNLGYGYDAQDSGGYKEPPDFVNMVHRTQTGHLPDPYDRKPVLQDISVYYTNMNYGGVSFAILGDRQWKSAPKPLFPEAEIENGWPQNKEWDPKKDAFHPDAQLLGQRQEDFLEDWISDWNSGIYLKSVISQSPFCNVATLPADIWHDKFVPGLPRYKKGEYPPDDRPVADFDSNGWPQNKRDKAIKTIRKAFALHITGDQHLGSTGQYGVDEFGDGGFWISTPAVANLWPRRWFPAQAARGGKAPDDKRLYTGNYEDGFGNKITLGAIANPYDIDREPAMVFDKAPGYSIIDFDVAARKMTLAVWPRWASVNRPAPDNMPFEGWPITIDQMENYGRSVEGYLPEIEVSNFEVLQVVEEQTGSLLYNLRPGQGTFKAPVFNASGNYTLKKILGDKVTEVRSGVMVVR